jgi:Nif-specific regulatory protein
MKKIQASTFAPIPPPAMPYGHDPELLLAAAEVGKELASADGVTDRLARGMRVLDRRLGAARCVLYLADSERRSLTVQATHGVAPDQFRPRFGLGVAGRVAESQKPIVVPVVRHDAMALSELSELSTWKDAGWNLVAVPSVRAQPISAVLCAYFRHRDPAGFGARIGAMDVVLSLMWKAIRGESLDEAAPSQAEAEAPSPQAIFEYSNMIGASVAMRQVYEQVGQVARTNATALLRGESGTGKELVARAIHKNSPRATMPFIKVNCAALPEPLFESELFGHERGAFTGAHTRKKGRFELAQGGTLFLDELGELSLATQAKLLRVLQFREFERLGGEQTIHTDTRIIAATNKDMERAVREGTFREDLYYRINVFTINLPPLRERRADVPSLAEYFLKKLAVEHQKKISRISSGALDVLAQYSWPGNVRELENVIERAVVVCDGSVIEERHLTPSIVEAKRPDDVENPTLEQAVERLERRMVQEALSRERGSIAAAARVLGTTERVLRYKLQKLKIDPSEYRS